MQKTKTKRRKKILTKVSSGMMHVHATFNNTIVTVTDLKGKVLCWSSAGTSGFKGSRKSTPFAASIAAREAAKKAREHGISDIKIRLKGPGPGKESAVRSLRAEGFIVKGILDVTPMPHNGCRPKKRRRV
ncbi:MAG: 30S ribosomal protein S11 [Candidatus Omnitrophica bacterium]|nr:30S ribosomal protein S11 [Candidatus Omnitrophota bacterium]